MFNSDMTTLQRLATWPMRGIRFGIRAAGLVLAFVVLVILMIVAGWEECTNRKQDDLW